MLRLDPVNLICVIINLLILYFLMKKFLFQPVRNILRQREEEIQQSFAEADDVKVQADALKKQYETSLGSIERQRTDAMAKTREDAQAEYDRIVAQAKGEADRLLADARVQAEEEGRGKLREAAGQIADLVADAAARIAVSKTDAANDQALYERFLSEAAAQTMPKEKDGKV